jgi:YVTN family beta-propeller protein
VTEVAVGSQPYFAAADYATQTLYVTNSGSGTVSVINMAQCNSHNVSGCRRDNATIHVGKLPLGLAVDQATDTVYVANAGDNTVSVINGAECNSTRKSGCGQVPAIVTVGTFGDAVAVDPVTNMVFVTNQNAQPGTVSVIDGTSCDGTHVAGCQQQPFATVSVGGGPSGVGVNPVTNTVYVANTAEDSNNRPVPDGDTLSVIKGGTCAPASPSGCAPAATIRVGADPANVGIDPATNTVYVANTYDNTGSPTGTVSVVNGAHCDARDLTGCASQVPPQVQVGADPVSAEVDTATGTVYVTNWNGETISLLKTSQCDATQRAGCKKLQPTLTVGSGPSWVVVHPALDTIYIVDTKINSVMVAFNR